MVGPRVFVGRLFTSPAGRSVTTLLTSRMNGGDGRWVLQFVQRMLYLIQLFLCVSEGDAPARKHAAGQTPVDNMRPTQL